MERTLIHDYNLSNSLNDLVGSATLTSNGGSITAGTGVVTGYVNGIQEITFTDTTNDAVFDAANNIMWFFDDDNVTGQRESSAGLATHISIYDGALTTA